MNRRNVVLGIALLALCALIQFWPFFFGKTLVFGDNYSLMVPGKLFTARWIKQGVVPLWNPYIFSGLPWIQDVNQSVLYPSTLLFVLLSPAVALNATIVSHLILTGIGAWLLGRRWIRHHSLQLVPAVLWAFSTQVAGSIHNLSTIQSISWLPWLVWLGLLVPKKSAAKIGFALVVLVQFLGGYPQHVIYSIFAAVLVSLVDNWVVAWSQPKRWRRLWQWLLPWVMTAAVTLGISAVAWLPFAQQLLKSTRLEQSITQAQVGSLNPPMLLKAVLPYIFDKPTAGMKWGPAWNGQPNMVFYLSLLGVALVMVRLFKRRLPVIEQFFRLFVVLSLLFALGSYLPGFSLIQTLIPLFRVGRYPSMILMVTNLFLAIWVGIAISQVKLSKSLFQKLFKIVSALVVLLGIGFWLVQRNFATVWTQVDAALGSRLSTGAFHTLAKDQIIASVIGTNMLTVAVFLLLALFFWRMKRYGLLVIVLALDLIVHTHGNFQFAPNASYDFNADALVANLPRTGAVQAHQYRWLTRGSNRPYTDYGAYWEAMIVRQPFSDSFVDQQELRDFSKLTHLRDGLVPDWNQVAGARVVHGYTTLVPQDYAKIWQQPDSPTRINFLDEIDPNAPTLQQWATKYYLVDTAYAIQEDLSSLPLVQTVDQWQVRELPGALPRFRSADGTDVTIESITENPNMITLSVTAAAANEFIIADRFDADWRAKVNGENVPVTDYEGMRSIPLQAGSNSISLWYSPTLFYVSLFVSLVSVLGAVFVWRVARTHWQTE